MNLFVLFLVIFVIWGCYHVLTRELTEGEKLVNYRRLIQLQHSNGWTTDEEYYEKYYDYKEKMKDWEIKSGFAAYRETEHPYWKDYYRRHEERKEDKLKEK